MNSWNLASYIAAVTRMRTKIRVVGYPGHEPMQTVTGRDVNRGKRHLVECRTLNYHTGALPKRLWPRLLPPNRPIQRDCDIFCSYKPQFKDVVEQDLLTLSRRKKHELDSLPLTGMSGCGIWLEPNEAGESNLTVPEARLVGLQTSYPKGGLGNWVRRNARSRRCWNLSKRSIPDWSRNSMLVGEL